MLDMKHKNIGATVSMLRLISGLTDSNKLPEEITKLFMVESNECDHKHETGQCTFHAGEDLIKALQTGNSSITFQCCIGECPLGPLYDKETSKGIQHFGADPVIDFGDRHLMSHKWWYNNRLIVGIVISAFAAFLLCL